MHDNSALKARPITFASVQATHEGRGFLVIAPTDPLRRPYGHVRLSTDAMDPVSLNFHARNGVVATWRYRGPLYEGDALTPREEEYECDVQVAGYHFGGGEGVRAMVVAVSTRPTSPTAVGDTA